MKVIFFTEELEQHATWLKYNKEPWSEVLIHWQATVDLRVKAKNNSVQDLITDWPILKQPLGYTLVSICYIYHFCRVPFPDMLGLLLKLIFFSPCHSWR